MTIIQNYLDNDGYYQEITKKHQIVLHHTVSKSFDSTFGWWQNDGVKVGTAYVIDKDGKIYEVFNPDYWAYHLGKGTTAIHNKSAIGIELVNEGKIWKKNDLYYWWDGNYKFKGDVYTHDKIWRESKYWASYSEIQINSLTLLLKKLLDRYNINKTVISTYQYNKNLLYENCIISHHNVREDKTDVSVALNLKNLQNNL